MNRDLKEGREQVRRKNISLRGSSKCKGSGVNEEGCSKNSKEVSGAGIEGEGKNRRRLSQRENVRLENVRLR